MHALVKDSCPPIYPSKDDLYDQQTCSFGCFSVRYHCNATLLHVPLCVVSACQICGPRKLVMLCLLLTFAWFMCYQDWGGGCSLLNSTTGLPQNCTGNGQVQLPFGSREYLVSFRLHLCCFLQRNGLQLHLEAADAWRPCAHCRLLPSWQNWALTFLRSKQSKCKQSLPAADHMTHMGNDGLICVLHCA